MTKLIHLDQYHYHEMLERAFLAGDIMQKITDHPVAKQHVEVRKQVNKILKECAELYAICGTLTYEDDGKQ